MLHFVDVSFHSDQLSVSWQGWGSVAGNLKQHRSLATMTGDYLPFQLVRHVLEMLVIALKILGSI